MIRSLGMESSWTASCSKTDPNIASFGMLQAFTYVARLYGLLPKPQDGTGDEQQIAPSLLRAVPVHAGGQGEVKPEN